MIQSQKQYDDYGNNPYNAYLITDKGINWLINNQEKFNMYHSKPKPLTSSSPLEAEIDDMPF